MYGPVSLEQVILCHACLERSLQQAFFGLVCFFRALWEQIHDELVVIVTHRIKRIAYRFVLEMMT